MSTGRGQVLLCVAQKVHLVHRFHLPQTFGRIGPCVEAALVPLLCSGQCGGEWGLPKWPVLIWVTLVLFLLVFIF